MKERPILFSAEMVRAILDGRKTQTRRVIKPQPPEMVVRAGKGFTGFTAFWNEAGDSVMEKYCPYGEWGDLLYVRETHSWKTLADNECRNCMLYPRHHPDGYWVEMLYRTDWIDKEPLPWNWRPSIHMPKWATRIWLEITKVWVERIQDISLADCKAEGILPAFNEATLWKDAFRELWHDINFKRGFGWNVNPWVWAVEFKVLDA